MSEPLTPSDLDLRDFPYMPLDVVRLRDSEGAVTCSGEEFRAAVILWCAAWHQVPAASLPNDDRLLAHLAGYGRDLGAWKAVRDGALRCFILCSDGRLYHPVIAEKAIEAEEKRKGYATKMANARSVLAEKRASMIETNIEANKGHKGRKGKGREDKKYIRAVANATRPFDEFWEAYPKRDGANPKDPARKKFTALVKSGADPGEIIAAAKRYAGEMRSKGQEKTPYVAQAVTWLNQRRHGDYGEPEPPKIVETPGFYAVFSSPQMDAWSEHERTIGKSFPRDKSGGWRFPTEWPPGHERNAA